MDLDSLFRDNEFCIYQIKLFKDIRDIEDIGSMTTRLHKHEDVFEIENEMEILPQKLKEKTRVTVHRKDLMPRLYETRITVADHEAIIQGEYTGNRVDVSAQTKGKKQQVKLDLVAPYYDNSSGYYVLRAYAFGMFKHDQFHIVNLNTAQKALVQLERIGEEEVECALGTFSCIGVRLRLAAHAQVSGQTFFYDTKEPHYLIRNVAGPQIIELHTIEQ